MIKKLLSLIVFVAMVGTITVSAQTCTPDAQYSAPGVYPDTLVGLPCAQTTVLYQTTITVIAPTDSLFDLGPPLNTINATIDSIKIRDNSSPADGIAVNGLPASMQFVCNPPSCSFPGGSTGCLLIIGTPTAAEAGLHPLSVEVSAYVAQLAPFGNPPVDLDPVDQYSIMVSATAPPVPVVTTVPATQGPPACDGTATATDGVTYQWDNNAGAATTATASNLCAGTYNVAAIDVNGCAGVATVTVGLNTGIDSKEPGIIVTNNSPNPFKDKTGISFELVESGMVNFIVIDMVGKVIYSESTPGVAGANTIEFDANGITPGVYMYNLVSGVHAVSGKTNVAK